MAEVEPENSSPSLQKHPTTSKYEFDNPAFVSDKAPTRTHHNSMSWSESIIYSWTNVNAHVKTANQRKLPCFKRNDVAPEPPKQILHDVSASAKPGEILAIMGASGAGKTTLLNFLTFRSTESLKVTGNRLFNGVPIDVDTLTLLSAYIQQQDIFIGTLTPREHLQFQAMLRMDKKYSYKERMDRVEEVILEMGLTGCADTIIGIPGMIKGLSGGQQKRLSVASEIITDPKLLICDEPTTGLDSFMAKSLLSSMKALATKGKTVICTIHQPTSDIFAMFDRLLLMSEGRIAYNGPANEATSYFCRIGYACPSSYNPADYFIHTLAIRPGNEEQCLQRSKEICDSHVKNHEADENGISNDDTKRLEELKKEAKLRKRSPYKASWFAQFRACLWRSWKTVMKNPMILKVQLFQTIFVALVVGIIYLGQDMDQEGIQNISGCIFIIMANLTFTNAFPVMNIFWQELPVFLRETSNGVYRTDAYYLGKSLAELPIYLMMPVIYISILYYMVGFNPAVERFLVAVAIVLLVANVGSSFGYMVSTVGSSFEVTMALAPIFIMPFMLFGGTFMNKDSIPVYFVWMKYLSWFLYGNEAMNINQWKGVKDIDCGDSFRCVKTGEQVLENMSFKESNFWTSIIGLGGLIVATRVISFFGLLMKARKRQ